MTNEGSYRALMTRTSWPTCYMYLTFAKHKRWVPALVNNEGLSSLKTNFKHSGTVIVLVHD